MMRVICPIAAAVIATLAQGAPMNVTAADIQRFPIYHSPQTPGYTCWVGVWLTPGGSLKLAFHQATGPFAGRPGGRKDVLENLGWPPKPAYDMTGTTQQIITLESRDLGKTWTPFSAEPFHTPMNGCVDGYCALSETAVLRVVWGNYLPFYDVPQTGYVQRSDDGGKSWGQPILLMDPAKAFALPKRIRRLQDGRLATIGGVCWLNDQVRTWRQALSHIEACLWLSGDAGATWGEPIVFRTKADGPMPSEESDLAELPDGRLVIVTRSDGPGARWQAVLKPVGDTYQVESRGPAPFPHSGMPDVLALPGGIVLHIATSNVSWTADAGQTWHDLGFGTQYYPASVLLPDGRVFVAAHRGSDDPYDGSVDQQIEGLTFRLQQE